MRLMRRLTVVVTGCALSLGWMASLGASASMRAEQICLSDEPPLRVVTDCPDIEAAVDVVLGPEELIITVTNAGDTPWGGPVAAELPVAENVSDTSLVDRGGFRVARCAFETPFGDRLAPEESVTCKIKRTLVAPGASTLWITGFRGAVPTTENGWGTLSAERGVVPVATARSVEFEVAEGKAKVVGASETDEQPPTKVVVAPPERKDAASNGFRWYHGALAAGLVLIAAVNIYRRMRSADA